MSAGVSGPGNTQAAPVAKLVTPSCKECPGSSSKTGPEAPGSFDLILAVNMLHELDEPGEFARRAVRTLATGGALLVVDWSPAIPTEQGPPKEHRIAESRAIEIFSEAGLALRARPPLYRDFYSLVFGFEDSRR